jgi:NAD-dependent SIR2 family protein deacetylase
MKKFDKDCKICKDYIDFVVPEEIINEIHNVILFTGAGVSTESERVFPDTLYQDIINELELQDNQTISFSKAMSLYVKRFGSRTPLINKIKERLDYFKAWPELFNRATEFHEEIAVFPCIENLVTTNWDDFLETIANATPFVYDTDIPFWDTSGRKVLKIHGSINDLGSIIATEEDYKRCYRELNKNTIGSKLKLLLAQNIIVFIGYSFKDYDFQRIYKYISSKMGDFRRQAYVVTLDKSNENNWIKYNLKPIYTEGSYFIYQLRKVFEQKKCLLSLENLSKVLLIQKYTIEIHDRTAKKYKHTEFPEIIYCLSYQDGILHALEYLINKIKGGKSLCTRYLSNSIDTYESLVKKYKQNWLEHSYLTGYLTGLYLFNGAMLSEIKLEHVPLFSYYNEINNGKFMTEKEFGKSLKLTSPTSRKRQRAKKFLDKLKIGKSVVFHHIPRI